MQRAFLPALCCVILLLGGCSTPARSPAKDQEAQAPSPQVLPSPALPLGRVLAIDARSLVVIIELAPYASVPFDLGKQTLICRQDDLRPTARLQASPYLRGRTLGATLLAGRPNVGDEVVVAPEGR